MLRISGSGTDEKRARKCSRVYGHVPSYSEWNRFWIFWRMGDGALAAVRVDDEFEPKGQAISLVNDFARMMLTEYINMEFADRPDLLAHVVPTYPVGAKRLLRDNGVWAGALKRNNVQLITDTMREITPTGIVMEDGTEVPAHLVRLQRMHGWVGTTVTAPTWTCCPTHESSIQPSPSRSIRMLGRKRRGSHAPFG